MFTGAHNMLQVGGLGTGGCVPPSLCTRRGSAASWAARPETPPPHHHHHNTHTHTTPPNHTCTHTHMHSHSQPTQPLTAPHLRPPRRPAPPQATINLAAAVPEGGLGLYGALDLIELTGATTPLPGTPAIPMMTASK